MKSNAGKETGKETGEKNIQVMEAISSLTVDRALH